MPGKLTEHAIAALWTSITGARFEPGSKAEEFARAIEDEVRALLAPTQQPSGEVTAFTTTVGRLLATAPHFEECETPEPCLSALIHRYYENYFDREKGREHAELYIAALYEAARAQGGDHDQ
ncbi:hypothetical protein [Burkholderia multivorans]|uniref:hypothetical protein n=1 Tax=Burkholderia multivorans TaxID=87883 RepID=UPI0021BFDD5B|nr:hypothetical protein [Burkholderia multivorans]